MCEHGIKMKILTVDSDEYNQNFYRKLMVKNGYRVTDASSGQKGLSVATSICPDVILIDSNLPDMEGEEFIREVRSWSDCIIIAVSEKKETKCKVSMLDAGADDYIVKPYDAEELLARIRSSLRRRGSLNTMVPYQAKDLQIDYDKRTVLLKGKAVHLSPVEYRILEYLSLNSGKVVTYRMLMEKIWGPYSTDNKILRVNITHIRNKIEENSAVPEYIFTETRVGYRMLANQISEEQQAM